MTESTPVCPNCKEVLDKWPEKHTLCQHCGEFIFLQGGRLLAAVEYELHLSKQPSLKPKPGTPKPQDQESSFSDPFKKSSVATSVTSLSASQDQTRPKPKPGTPKPQDQEPSEPESAE